MGIKEMDEWKRNKDIQSFQKRYDSAKTKIEWDIVHREYMRSGLWKQVNEAALVRSGGACERCGVKGKRLNVHHLTYDHVGGKEKLSELQAVCYECHKKLHEIRNRKNKEIRLGNLYYSRVTGFAIRKYGEKWDTRYDFDEVEEEFQKYMFKKYCADIEIDYYPGLEEKESMLFFEFCGLLKSGEYQFS